MSTENVVPEEVFSRILPYIGCPLHDRDLRGPKISPADGEADLSAGFRLEAEEDLAAGLGPGLEDFETFLRVSMQLSGSGDGYLIRLEQGKPQGCPSGAGEAFHLDITDKECRLVCSDVEGARRALVFLEDEMILRRAPHLPLGKVSRHAVIKDRISRGPAVPYRWLTGWELEDDREYYPDEYLNRLAHCGINGIWVAGLLRRMLASKVLPELGPPEHRLDVLARLVERAKRYGIKVWLFCMEPRTVEPDHPVLKAHPEVYGAIEEKVHASVSLCTSTPIVQEYIRESMCELFSAVPELGGVINLFCGERTMTCWMSPERAATCPRCSKRSQAEVLAEDLNCFMEGIREAGSRADLVAWQCGPSGSFEKISEKLHPDVVWMGLFEHGARKMVDGKKVQANEYSLSCVGPSESYAQTAEEMEKHGRRAWAKLQLGVTYELATQPYIPIPGTVYDKFEAMQKAGVSGSMVSWIIGGFPGPMLKAAGEASLSPLPKREDFLQRLASLYATPSAASSLVGAWEKFGQSFGRYLCAPPVFYYGPIPRCPGYKLHLEKEKQPARNHNWGLTHFRDVQPFPDSTSLWTGPYTPEEVMVSFREMARIWQGGLDILAELPDTDDLREQLAVAAAIRLQFLSAANVYEFYLLREGLKEEKDAAAQADIVKRLMEVTADDTALAQEMLELLPVHPGIGFHSEMVAYSYSEPLINEKIRHDECTLRILQQWERTGVDMKVLQTVLPTPVVEPWVGSFDEPSVPGWLERGD
jgi:hypothetical protein